MDEASLRAHYGSTRKRNGTVFVLDQHGPNADYLHERAAALPGSFVTWERNGLTLPGGKRVGARYALWVPAPVLPEPDEEPDYEAPWDIPSPPPRMRVSKPPYHRHQVQETPALTLSQADVPDARHDTGKPGFVAPVAEPEEHVTPWTELVSASQLTTRELIPPLQDIVAPATQPASPEESPPAEPESETAEPRRARRKMQSLHPRRAPKTTKHKNITRIDHPKKHTFGYFVRIQWKGERRVKFFSDAQYGDRLGALAAALEWRNETEREMGKPRTERQVVGKTRGTSGVIGVRRRIDQGVPYYEATWVENGKINRTRYSVAKHGERKARAMAVKVRMRKERERQLSPRDEE